MNYFKYILDCNNKQTCFICNDNLVKDKSRSTLYDCKCEYNVTLAYIHQSESYSYCTVNNLYLQFDFLHEELNIYTCRNSAKKEKLLVYHFLLEDGCYRKYITFKTLQQSDIIEDFIITYFEDIKFLCNMMQKVQVFS